ncbi:MAG: hypothetical protein KME54_27925 [Tolypothrix brevis GSE-NOS-MK-07-07A]|nr:hypothetical protein [Tolypothrix brevis GSE-NOS-MK-07-07A]
MKKFFGAIAYPFSTSQMKTNEAEVKDYSLKFRKFKLVRSQSASYASTKLRFAALNQRFEGRISEENPLGIYG